MNVDLAIEERDHQSDDTDGVVEHHFKPCAAPFAPTTTVSAGIYLHIDGE